MPKEQEKFKEGQSFGGNISLYVRMYDREMGVTGIELMGMLNLKEMKGGKSVSFRKSIPICDILMFGEEFSCEIVVMDFIAHNLGWAFMENVDYSVFMDKVKECIERAKEQYAKANPRL